MTRNRKHTLAALALVAGVQVGGAQAANVYTQNFESGVAGAEWSGAGTVQDSLGLAAFGFGEMHLKNDSANATVLTVGGLAAHTQLTLSFSLAMWDSIDLGDHFVIQVDGASVYDSTDFGNYFPPENIGRGPGTQITDAFTSFGDPQYGYSGFRDSARVASFTVNHAASSVVITWAYPDTQGGADESFGVDNIVVSTNAAPVPLPASLPMMGLGVLGLAALRKQRRA